MTEGFPLFLVQKYRRGEISRAAFIQRFGDWQKEHGYNFDLKGYGNKYGLFLLYRGITGQINKNAIEWRDGRRILSAANYQEFKIRVDHQLCREARNG